jgi:TonB-linked SusC/RagA family outer membrane protein
MRKIASLLSVLMLLCTLAFGQTRTVTGTVKDETGTPVPFATVTETGTRNATTADATGNFTITIQHNGRLSFSASGFQAMSMSAAPSAGAQEIILKRAEGALQEVVVTALGIRREKKALGYAVSTVDKKQLESRPDGDIARLLSGKAPGVDILPTSGISGSGTNIQIRGANSITGSTDPLFVVDGTPFNGSTNDQAGPIYGNQTSSRFMDIDPNNIESISILKGLSATVLYGEQGRNGVILITTKNGAGKRTNKKAEVSVAQSYFITKVSNLPDYQDTYGGGFSLAGGFSFFSNWGPKFTTPYQLLPHPYSVGAVASSFPELAGQMIEFKPQNNVKAFFNTGSVKNTSVNVSGALGANGSINANYSYLDDQGFLLNNRVFRNTFGLGINTKLSNNITIQGVTNFVLNNFKSPTTGYSTGSGAQSGGSSVYADLIYTPRANDLVNWPYQTPDGASAYYRPNNDIQNPIWALHNSLTGQKTARVYGNFAVKYDILKNLNLTYRIGYDTYNEHHALTINKGGKSTAVPVELEYERGIYRTVDATNRIWDHAFILQYNTKFSDDLRFDVTAGAQANNQQYNQAGIKSSEQLVFGLFDHSNFINHDTKSEDGLDMDYKSEVLSLGVYAQTGLSYKEFVFLNVGARNTWSSTLESEHNSKLYPSGSVSFIPTAAFAGLQSKALNYLKVRAGYATSARYPGPYNTRPSLVISTNDFVDRGSNVINTNVISNRLANPDLKPELLGELEAGIEGRFIDNRVSLDLTLYNRKSTKQILDRPLDPSTGYTITTINAGDLTNKGIELGLGYAVIRNRDWNWQLDGNFALNRSKVSNLPDYIAQVQTGGLFSNLGNFAINGERFGVIKGTYWQKDPKTGQRIVGPDGYYIASGDAAIIGDPNPDYKLTGISTLGYKGVEFRMQWDYTKGGDMYSGTTNVLLSRGLTKDTDVDRARAIILPGVKQDGTPNDFQTAMDRAYFNTYLGAREGFIYDATVLRLREVSLGYSLPPSLLTKTPLGAVSITLSGQNLWFDAPGFPEFVNFDPETSSGGVSKTRGFEFLTGPNSKRYGATLRVTF